MTLWQRIKQWIYGKPQSDDPTTLIPDGTQPIPSDFFVPGESQVLQAEDKWQSPPTH